MPENQKMPHACVYALVVAMLSLYPMLMTAFYLSRTGVHVHTIPILPKLSFVLTGVDFRLHAR